jgi:hypothetical protein
MTVWEMAQLMDSLCHRAQRVQMLGLEKEHLKVVVKDCQLDWP